MPTDPTPLSDQQPHGSRQAFSGSDRHGIRPRDPADIGRRVTIEGGRWMWHSGVYLGQGNWDGKNGHGVQRVLLGGTREVHVRSAVLIDEPDSAPASLSSLEPHHA